MIKFFQKIKFLFKRPKVIIIAGRGQKTAAKAVGLVLKNHFKIGQELLICPAESEPVADLEFMLKNSKLGILVATHVGQYSEEREFFTGEPGEAASIEKLAAILPVSSRLILNFDDETIRALREKSHVRVLTFGFAARADIRASDVSGANFKINYEGNIVPVWLPNLFGKEHIYAALAAAAVAEVLGLNLVEVSEALKQSSGMLQ